MSKGGTVPNVRLSEIAGRHHYAFQPGIDGESFGFVERIGEMLTGHGRAYQGKLVSFSCFDVFVELGPMAVKVPVFVYYMGLMPMLLRKDKSA